MERESKLLGLDAPQRIEMSGDGMGPAETQEPPLDFNKLTLEELLQFEALQKKAQGLPPGTPGVIDAGPYSSRTQLARRLD
jgi:hypothetical protein